MPHPEPLLWYMLPLLLLASIITNELQMCKIDWWQHANTVVSMIVGIHDGIFVDRHQACLWMRRHTYIICQLVESWRNCKCNGFSNFFQVSEKFMLHEQLSSCKMHIYLCGKRCLIVKSNRHEILVMNLCTLW